MKIQVITDKRCIESTAKYRLTAESPNGTDVVGMALCERRIQFNLKEC